MMSGPKERDTLEDDVADHYVSTWETLIGKMVWDVGRAWIFLIRIVYKEILLNKLHEFFLVICWKGREICS